MRKFAISIGRIKFDGIPGTFPLRDRHFYALAGVDKGSGNLYIWGMEMIPLTPERKAQLEEYAQRHGQEPAAALDDVLADAFCDIIGA